LTDDTRGFGESRRAQLRRRGRARLRTMLWIASVLIVMGLGLLIDSALYRGKVHAGVSVSGVTLGGLTEDEATAALTRYVTEAQVIPVTLLGGDRAFDVTPADAGVKIDVAGAVSAAMGVTRDSNFVVDLARRFTLYFGDKDLPFEGTVDGAKLDSLLAEIAKGIDVPCVPAGLAITDGVVTVIEGRKGSVVEQDLLRERLTGAFLLLRATELPIPMKIEEPVVLADDNRAALEDAETMIGAAISLTYGDRSWNLAPDDIAAYVDVSFETEGGVSTLVPFLSSSKMSPLLGEISDLVAKEPVDASFKSNGQMAWVIPGEAGRALDREATAEALTAAALKTGGRTAAVVVVKVDADLTTQEAEAMGIENRLGSYETKYECEEERQQNVRVTTKYAEAFVAPGDRYNFDRQIGPRTEERGFRLAPGIVGQGSMEDVLGGGICQVSTTLFNAAFEAGLEIVERHNHSLYISHYPPGRDATVTDGGRNLQFKNDTDHYIWVRGWSDGITTRFSIYGTDDGREVMSTFSGWTYGEERTVDTVVNPSLSPGVTAVGRVGQSGRSCTVTRTVTMPDGTVLHAGPEVYESNFEMIPKTIEVSPATTTTVL
jgi:vancomycin resistance protein YoaR